MGQGGQADQAASDACKTAIRQQVDSAASLPRWAHGLETAGALSRSQAQQLAANAVRGPRCGDQAYFWINDMTPRVVLLPIKPALEGQDVSGVKQPDGNPLFVRFVETVQRQQAGNVAGFAPWGLVDRHRAHACCRG